MVGLQTFRGSRYRSSVLHREINRSGISNGSYVADSIMEKVVVKLAYQEDKYGAAGDNNRYICGREFRAACEAVKQVFSESQNGEGPQKSVISLLCEALTE